MRYSIKRLSRQFFLFVSALIIIAAKSFAQDKEISRDLYIAATIPDSLKTEANSVLRYCREDYDVRGPGKMIYKSHSIVTILNEKASAEAVAKFNYNRKFSTISAFEMLVYDAGGKLIKKYHKSDMYDRAAIDNESIITDDRLLIVGHDIASYPVTIETTFEEDNKSLIGIGRWDIQGLEQSVQNTYAHLSIRSDAGFRYLNKNISIVPEKSTADKTDSYSWKVSNLKAIKLEDGAEPWRVLPRVDFAANDFEYYGIPGNISTWQNYGKWQKGLNADVCSLTPEREEEIRKMTDSIKTDKDKARFLYKYLQQNMRYVSVQLGIGGLKPFPASFVDEKKYGDCKALANYMCALLKAVNIPAYYAKVRAGADAEPCDPNFPNDMSNHIIVCIPFKGDTIWLECTNNSMPFGQLGTFTENRNALAITEDGGRLLSTPKSLAQANQFNSVVHIYLNPDGGAKASVKILSTGEYRFAFVGLAAAKLDRQKEFLIRELNMKQPSAFEFKDAADNDGLKELNLDLEYDKFCDVMTADKQFYRPLAFSMLEGTVPVIEKRKYDYYFDCPFQKSCVTTVDLPAGFEVETLPANASLKFSYGNYDINYVYNKDKNQVISTAKFILNNHVIPAARYTEMQQYMDGVAKAQNKKLVIRKKA